MSPDTGKVNVCIYYSFLVIYQRHHTQGTQQFHQNMLWRLLCCHPSNRFRSYNTCGFCFPSPQTSLNHRVHYCALAMRITKSPVIAVVVDVGVVVIVPILEDTRHIWVAFNIADLHAVQLFVLFFAPLAPLIKVA